MPSTTFTAVGWHTWAVPKGVRSVKVRLNGAGSGSNQGGHVEGNLAVTDGWVLHCLVGAQGRLNSGAAGGGTSSVGGAAGGTGQLGGTGGDGGGGASQIRINSRTGSLRAVAGGAGGDSGDGGRGGPGGGTTGGSGAKGTSGDNPTSPATGGTQSQGGNGGTSSAGASFNGRNAVDTILATGGAGGQTAATVPSHGGGGGGGGYRSGGGGQAASFGSKVLEATNQLPSPWDTAAVGATAARYTAYASGTRIQATNMSLNPGLEGGSTTGWNSNNGTLYPATLDTTSQFPGSVNSSLQTRTATTPSTVAASWFLVPSGASAGFACTPGQPIVMSVDWKCDQANRRASFNYQWLDAANAVISTQPQQWLNVPVTAANTIYRIVLTGVPPAGAVTARPILTVSTADGSNAVTGERNWIDNIRVSTGAVTADAVNLFQNPGVGDTMLAGSTGSWSSNNSALFPVTLESTTPIDGRFSVLTTRQAATPNRQTGSISLLGPQVGSAMAVAAGQQVTVGATVRAQLAGRRVEVYFQWFDAAGTLITSGVRGNYTNLTANTATRVSLTETAPANTAGVRVVLDVTTLDGSNATTGELTWFDSARVSVGTDSSYFSGSTPPDGTYVYSWLGTTGASQAQRWKISDQQMADATYFDGDTAATTQIAYNWSGTARASTSNRSFNGNNTITVVNTTVVATNRATNPSVEGGSIVGINSNDATLYAGSASTTNPISGTYSAMFTRSANTPTGTLLSAYITGMATAGINALPVPAGTTLTVAADVRVEAANRRVAALYLRWLNSSNTIIGTTTAQVIPLTSGQVTRVVATGTAPAGTAYAYLYMVLGSVDGTNIPTGERCWIDNVRVDFGTDSTFFSGATAASSPYSYRWTGAANASMSEKYTAADYGIPTTDKRPIVQVTNTGGNARTGIRTHSSANIAQGLTAGTTFTFSAWVRLSPGYPIGPNGLYAIFRDDPNNDSYATGSAGNLYVPINPGVWTRVSWTRTVAAGRNVTGIYIDTPIVGLVLPVGAYLQTTAWMVNKTPALIDFFDGDTADDSFYDFSWAGTRGASLSYKHHQTTPYSPGGGGGGGSSFTGGLTGAVNTQGAGGTGNGDIIITWSSPAPANQPPTPPTAVKINNVDATSQMLTKATTSVRVTATVNDPNPDKVRLVVRWSTSSDFKTFKEVSSPLVNRNTAVTLTLSGLAQNTRYFVRLFSRDQHNLWSTNFTTVDFWTNRAPSAETNSINSQGSGMQLPSISSALFRWTHHDPDVADYQTAFRIRYRVAATSTQPAGPWTNDRHDTGSNTSKDPGPPTSSVNEWTYNPNTFKGNRFYEWSVVTRDGQGLWGTESLMFQFWVSSTTSPPVLLTPRSESPIDINNANTFTWRFIDPDPIKRQVKADLRYRAVGNTKAIADGDSPTAGQWITLLGVATTGTSATIPEGSFLPGFTYEWEVRTYNSTTGPASDWSDPFFFYAIGTPGADAGPFPIPDNAKPQGELGCGSYRVFIYQQGGQKLIGEVEPINHLVFTRLRDDISNCVVDTSGYSYDCGQLYGTVRSWMHELVVFRDGVRVWEGPITRITYTTTSVEFEAKDVMAYVYRRVMRVGYNDAYRLIQKGTGGQPDVYLGLLSVVKRAQELIVQALAPYDPNVLPYLTGLEFPDDARESRVVANWSRTVWEEVDDLAATAGLDYTTVGRRILLWDTHRSIGRLPELRDGDFSDSPIVTEYGMQLATFVAVTNGSGVAGYVEVPARSKPYGPVELVASSYSETDSTPAEITTPAALAEAQAALTEQAKRNISGRWPTPLIVRIPDNTTLSPKANVGFQQLIPGVWLPLRSVGTPRPVLQWQKLDSVSVEVDDKGESVHVVLSPAPQGGQDPDADQGSEPD